MSGLKAPEVTASRASKLPAVIVTTPPGNIPPKHTTTMDIAYDHIQEENFPEDEEGKPAAQPQRTSLNVEFQEAFKAVSASPWGARLGGLWGGIRKQVLS